MNKLLLINTNFLILLKKKKRKITKTINIEVAKELFAKG